MAIVGRQGDVDQCTVYLHLGPELARSNKFPFPGRLVETMMSRLN